MGPETPERVEKMREKALYLGGEIGEIVIKAEESQIPLKEVIKFMGVNIRRSLKHALITAEREIGEDF